MGDTQMCGDCSSTPPNTPTHKSVPPKSNLPNIRPDQVQRLAWRALVFFMMQVFVRHSFCG
eukprot:NODE_5667_length_395_cov_60.716763_g4970_i0.p3 GENE.NODE_5667_length_395_cov_60.716763_g4970_i0~~NODE_5667_length_395_cov_60.716763_g4970_i0.p3  ORF type:complete len:61 (+),score=11.85 NODE_5667_length_395_cov_60.716763_g4970_i0:82-264(+)